MLGDLIRALRRTNVVPEMFGQVVEMLEIGKWMFLQASEVLIRETDWHGVADELYAKDRQINKIDRWSFMSCEAANVGRSWRRVCWR